MSNGAQEEKPYSVFLLGFGSVGQHVVKLMLQTGRRRPNIKIVGISDSSGGIFLKEGLPLEAVLKWKAEEKKPLKLFGTEIVVGENNTVGHFESSEEMLLHAAKKGNIAFDATPVDLETGGVGLRICRYCVGEQIHLVLANKSPLVLCYNELVPHAELLNTHIEYSATCCGGLPVVNVGKRDLHCAQIDLIEGIFNSTSNYILSRMEAGEDAETALKTAQEKGIAEADPSLDVNGFDTANKLVIICNSVLGIPTTLDRVSITGISEITRIDIREAAEKGEVYRLVATAKRIADKDNLMQGLLRFYDLSVEPRRVKRTSFLGSCVDTDMCVIFQSDEFEKISMKTNETGVFPTASAMLRDCFKIIRDLRKPNKLGEARSDAFSDRSDSEPGWGDEADTLDEAVASMKETQ